MRIHDERPDGHGSTTDGPSDGELLRCSANGDPGAFGQFVARHTPRVYRFARSLLGDADDAEDVTQETFIEAYRHAARFRDAAAAGPWLLGIAANRCRTLKRRLRRRPVSLEDLGWGADDERTPGGGDSYADGERVPLQLDVRRAIAQLPVPYRIPVVLRYLEEMSHAEIAETMGIEVNAASMRLHRAKTMLRELLSDETTPGSEVK